MLQTLTGRPRLVIATTLGLLLFFLLPAHARLSTRILLAWDLFTGLYLLLVGWMMMNSDPATMRQRAIAQDDGRMAILFLTSFAAVASLAATCAQLATAKGLSGRSEIQHIGLAGVTVFLSWTFMQTMFALHYAHEFYLETDGKLNGGLNFPGDGPEPDYWEFVYFSFVIGTAAQTADVEITSSTLRKIATLHCMIVFFFNTTIIALTINIAAGLLN